MNILAGMGGMSEYSVMTSGIPMVISYSAFGIGSALIGYLTYRVVRRVDQNKARRSEGK
jgi:magnesium transporter